MALEEHPSAEKRHGCRGKSLGLRLQLATGACLVLLLVSGAAYRAGAAKLGGFSAAIPLARGTLNALPLDLNGWRGRDELLDPRIVEATDTDDHVNRVYIGPQGQHSVHLYIAYGVNFRDLMPHRPEVCFPSAGWVLSKKSKVDVHSGASAKIPTQVFRFRRGALEADSVAVMSYYLVDGQYSPDMSLLRSQAWRPDEDIRYVAQIQIVSDDTAFARGDEAILAFARDCAAAIREFIESTVESEKAKRANSSS